MCCSIFTVVYLLFFLILARGDTNLLNGQIEAVLHMGSSLLGDPVGPTRDKLAAR